MPWWFELNRVGAVMVALSVFVSAITTYIDLITGCATRDWKTNEASNEIKLIRTPRGQRRYAQ